MLPTILLGLCTCLMAFGGFLIGTGVLGRSYPYNVRAGRMIRGFFFEMLGLGGVFGALQLQAKPPLAISAIVLGIGIGSMAGLFHAVLRNRSLPPTANDSK